eukprot:TRINITY_DN10408_c1_g1_i1.p3 TRINITY_DN10408_c1_g1~~TRINITY_DN10408_c1_g1_i1.p3  ORF type:complete len:104 (-),score=2.56 TRINITY_DN10408_c1_g1_i1:132-443(-)
MDGSPEPVPVMAVEHMVLAMTMSQSKKQTYATPWSLTSHDYIFSFQTANYANMDSKLCGGFRKLPGILDFLLILKMLRKQCLCGGQECVVTIWFSGVVICNND